MASRLISRALRGPAVRRLVTRRVLLNAGAFAVGGALGGGLLQSAASTLAQADVSGSDARLMGQEIEPAAQAGGTIVSAQVIDIASLNPLAISPTGASFYRRLIFEGLVEPDPFTLEPVGCLAESWAVSDDGLAWTFHLRDGIAWHDGEPFTAADVEFTYDLHLNPDSGSRYHASLNSLITGIETPDERTVVFTTPTLVVDFPLLAAVYAIGAEHVLSGIAPSDLTASDAGTGADPAMIVGTGPFKLQETIPGDHLTVVRYDDYWDGRPHLDAFTYKVVSTSDAMTSQILTGEVSFLEESDPASSPELSAAGLRLVESTPLGMNFVSLNLDPARIPLFQDQRVRQALLYAIDRQAVYDSVFLGLAAPVIGPIPPQSWAANPDGITVHYAYDPERANQLLDEAGWVRGADDVRAREGQRLAFTLATDATWAPWTGFATAIQEYWRQVGVQIELQLDTYEAVQERYASHDYDSVIFSAGTGLTPDQSALFACNSFPDGLNRAMYCNPESDELLTEASSTEDPEERLALYTRYQNLWLEDLPWLPLYRDVVVAVVDPRIHNMFPNSINTQFNAQTWWIEA